MPPSLTTMDPVTFADSTQSWELAKRIYDAYARRCLASRTSEVPGLDPVDKATTVFSFISEMQLAIETLATNRWLDPALDPDLITDEASATTFLAPASKDTFLAEIAGLDGVTDTAKYWRRIANSGGPPTDLLYDNVAFSYGRIQDKDLLGPWLFEDLQTALKAMTRTRTEIRWGHGKIADYYRDTVFGVLTCAQVFASPTDWDSESVTQLLVTPLVSGGEAVKKHLDDPVAPDVECRMEVEATWYETLTIGAPEDDYDKVFHVVLKDEEEHVPSETGDYESYGYFGAIEAPAGDLDFDAPEYSKVVELAEDAITPDSLADETLTPDLSGDGENTFSKTRSYLTVVAVDYSFGDVPS